MHGFQLWVNLPGRDKMMKPRYQEIAGPRIPVAVSDDALVTVRVIAGESLGSTAAIETRTPITYLHVTVKPGGKIEQPLPAGHNAFAYVIYGHGLFGSEEERAERGEMVLFNRDGEAVLIAATPQARTDLSVLLIAGEPLGEPVARYGPFVMNTEAEIHQAIQDYRAGRMGEINF
jgi:redox-sensitive bicupin YhaK (pirin superfamily)